jgi:hypothetical protein
MTVAFVLQGGGSLSAGQVGMLQALGEAGIRPDVILGVDPTWRLATASALAGASDEAVHSDRGVRLAAIQPLWVIDAS